MDINKIFKPKENKRSLMINIRVSEEEMDIIKKLSDKYTDGNMTQFIRKALLEIIPVFIKSELGRKK